MSLPCCCCCCCCLCLFVVFWDSSLDASKLETVRDSFQCLLDLGTKVSKTLCRNAQNKMAFAQPRTVRHELHSETQLVWGRIERARRSLAGLGFVLFDFLLVSSGSEPFFLLHRVYIGIPKPVCCMFVPSQFRSSSVNSTNLQNLQ